MKYFLLGLVFCNILFSGCAKSGSEVVLQSISVSPETLTMTTGDAVKLSPIFTPSVFSSIAVQWASSDPTVATVANGGYVTALKPGHVWISVKDKNSSTSAKTYVVIQ